MKFMSGEALRQQHDRKLLKIISTVALIIILAIIILIFIAERPMRQAREESATVAQKDGGIKRIDSFYTSDLNRTYYSIGGSNKYGKEMYVILNRHHKLIRVVPVNEGINRSAIVNEVRDRDHAHKIISVSPAIFDDKTVWIASYENRNGRLCYRIFKFSNGKSLQSITNV